MCYSRFARDACTLPLSGMLVEQLTEDLEKVDASLLEFLSGKQSPSSVAVDSPAFSGNLHGNESSLVSIPT
jgi:hypothetical protein